MLTETSKSYFWYVKNRLDPKQAAKILGLSVKTLAQWRCDGIGPSFFKIRGRVYYYKQDIESWLKEQGFYKGIN